MERILLALAALLFLVSPLNAQTYTAEVDAAADYIKDGDTPLIEIRMFGIDTPEKDQLCERANGSCYACGRIATHELIDLLLGKEATYRFTGDVTYGRPVASAFIDGEDVGLEMIRRGWAVAYTRYLPASMKPVYEGAEEDAKKAGRGIWQGKFVEPEKWRRGERLSCE